MAGECEDARPRVGVLRSDQVPGEFFFDVLCNELAAGLHWERLMRSLSISRYLAHIDDIVKAKCNTPKRSHRTVHVIFTVGPQPSILPHTVTRALPITLFVKRPASGLPYKKGPCYNIN